jgi:two-component system chemotaxis response regulator CheY
MSYTVLLCDDAKFTRMSLSGVVAKGGYEVVGEAGTGREAVEQYEALQPDLVLMDVVMPDMSGIDAVKEIKRRHAEARIVMCSAMGQQRLMQEALSAGARGFIVKPYEPSRVLEALSDAIQ